ncbi:GNAT family N-acetyltransferase [Corynebacterium atrinae]|uniref:GNAT family N-acetyltransferase n=1 Tax=Corynebacterium atrinae TaxID=1336740 RepID=UPI0025B4B45D|nr:GNAT family N-acetyltransferase [Corynebacterium atrinae]
MTAEIRRLSGPEFSVLAPQLVEIYIKAMGYDDSIFHRRTDSWRREIIQPGFTALAAFDGDRALGVAYGYLGSQDLWWDRQVRRGLREAGGPSTEQVLLMRDYFEVAEIHVDPDSQGRGLGRLLLSQLLWNAPGRHALLSTPEVDNEDNHAFRLYRSMGFHDVLRYFTFEGDARPFAVLAAPLPLPGMVEKPAADSQIP